MCRTSVKLGNGRNCTVLRRLTCDTRPSADLQQSGANHGTEVVPFMRGYVHSCVQAAVTTSIQRSGSVVQKL